MPSIVISVLRSHGGVATWQQLIERVSEHAVIHAAATGQIVRLLPRVYALPGADRSLSQRVRAALLFAGDGSCLSHVSALSLWPRLHVPFDQRVHVLTPCDRDRRSTGFVTVHRHGERSLPADLVTVRGDVPIVIPEAALLQSWAGLPPNLRRAPVIDAVRLGLADPDGLDLALRTMPKLRGRAELRRLIALLRAGCHSELELMGFTRVFSDRRLPPARHQHEIVIDGTRYILDVAWPELLLAVELDGAAYHGSNEARERDVQRDAVLARAGWVTVRVTYDRLVRDVDAVVADLLATIATRRRQLGFAA